MNQKPISLEQHFPGLSRLSFGCMGLGGTWDDAPIEQHHFEAALAATDAALEAGINFFDHADIYTLGKAERVFADVMKARPGLREKIFIQSKCAIRFADEAAGLPGRYDFSKEYISDSVDGILKRLDIDYLDILLLHRPDPLMEPEEVAEVFDGLKDSGKVRHFGVSNMNAHQIDYLQSYLDQPLIVNQIPLNLAQLDWLDEGVLTGTPEGKDVNFAPGTLEYCRRNGVQIQSWGSLAQGLFSGRDISQESDTVKATAAYVQELAQIHGCSREAIVLAFLMRHPVGIQPVIGTINPDRVRACGEATRVELSREQWYKLYVTSRGQRLP